MLILCEHKPLNIQKLELPYLYPGTSTFAIILMPHNSIPNLPLPDTVEIFRKLELLFSSSKKNRYLAYISTDVSTQQSPLTLP